MTEDKKVLTVELLGYHITVPAVPLKQLHLQPVTMSMAYDDESIVMRV